MKNNIKTIELTRKIREKQYDEIFYFMGKIKTIRRCKNGSYFVVLTDEKQGDNTSTYRWTGSVYTLISNELSASEVKVLYESNANTNAYTDAEQTKLGTIATGSQVNVIEVVKQNGVPLTITNKAVDVDVPTKTSEVQNDGNGSSPFVTAAELGTAGYGDMTRLEYATNGI